MAINKKLIHFKNFSDFNSKKLSANENNTQYTLGISGAVTNGSPDILYQSICYIKDTKQQWTHGQLYDGTNLKEAGFLAGEETSDQLDDVETNTYVKYVQQTLTEEQKAQVRANIGVGTGSGGNTKWNPEYLGQYTGTSISLDPYKIYYGAAFNNDTTITFNTEEDYGEWRIIFYISPNTSLSVPVDLWANGNIPDISAGGRFELSVVDDDGVLLGVLSEFKEL
jgi:hypothetical protein